MARGVLWSRSAARPNPLASAVSQAPKMQQWLAVAGMQHTQQQCRRLHQTVRLPCVASITTYVV